MRSAARDAATAWGLARPVLLSLLARGAGSRLVRREPEARELAGRLVSASSILEVDLGGWKEARRFEDVDAAEFWADSRGFCSTPPCCEGGRGDASRSRNDSRECPVLVGVSLTWGDSDAERPRGLRKVGSLDPLALDDPGVTDEAERWVIGDRCLA